jgi:Protein of unknown function (DUF3716)
MEPDYPELSILPETHTKLCAKLVREHDVVRALELRAGATLKGLEKGKANLEAALAYLRGELQERECVHCSEKSSGPFRRCVVLKHHFGSSCTNCRYNEEQTRCSLRGIHQDILDLGLNINDQRSINEGDPCDSSKRGTAYASSWQKCWQAFTLYYIREAGSGRFTNDP